MQSISTVSKESLWRSRRKTFMHRVQSRALPCLDWPVWNLFGFQLLPHQAIREWTDRATSKCSLSSLIQVANCEKQLQRRQLRFNMAQHTIVHVVASPPMNGSSFGEEHSLCHEDHCEDARNSRKVVISATRHKHCKPLQINQPCWCRSRLGERDSRMDAIGSGRT